MGSQFYVLVRIESRISLGLVRDLRRRNNVRCEQFLYDESMFWLPLGMYGCGSPS